MNETQKRAFTVSMKNLLREHGYFGRPRGDDNYRLPYQLEAAFPELARFLEQQNKQSAQSLGS